MANKEKKTVVSFSKIDEITKQQMKERHNQITISFESTSGDPIEIIVTPTLPIADVFAFVRDVANAVFDGDDYIPAAYEYAYAKAILSYFTNIKDDISDERISLVMFETDVLYKVLDTIRPQQLSVIESAIENEIGHRKNSILSNQKRLLQDALVDIQRLIDTFESFSSQFENLDVEKTLEVAQKLADKDEKQIVDSIIGLKNE